MKTALLHIYRNFMRHFLGERWVRYKLYGKQSDLTPAERDAIIQRLSEFEAPRYIEIGVYFGGTFEAVLAYLEQNKKVYQAVGIDLFEKLRDVTANRQEQTHEVRNKWGILNVAYCDELQNYFRKKGYTHFTLYSGQSDQLVKDHVETFDVVFIDGNHTYQQTLLDAQSCLAKAHPGSYLIFHNASPDGQPDRQYIEQDGGPWKVCEELKQDLKLRFYGLADRCAIFTVIQS